MSRGAPNGNVTPLDRCFHFSIAYRPKKADILTKTQKLGRIDRG